MLEKIMIDYFLVILVTVILLLFVQVLALFRIRYLIKQLKKALKAFNTFAKMAEREQDFPQSLQKCQFCRFRKTYLDASDVSGIDNWNYRCALTDKAIQLNGTCSRFQPEKYYLDKSQPL